MAKQSARTATPRLRFPEFSDKPKWPVTKLGSRGKFIGGGTPSRANAELWMGRHPWISSSDVSEEDIRSISPSRFITDEAVANSATQAVPTGSVLIVSRVGVGKIAVTQEQLYTSQDFASLVPSTDCPEFLAYLLKSRQSTLLAFNQGMAIKGFTRDDIAGLDVPIPDRAEQQKIADCLTSLDELIAAQGRKVEALNAHKRGLMQQLFPREGESRPRLRFPEFRDAPEWITRPLGELMAIGSSRRVHESDWTTAGVPFYRAREIVALAKGEPIAPLFISETLYKGFAGYTGEIEDGQLLVTGVGSIGIPYLVKSGDRFYFKDGNIIWLKNNQAELTGNFLLRLFESEYVQGQIATMAGIGTVGTYTIDNAKRTIVVFPTDKREQQSIADCLSSLDTRITAETNQLAALKTHKQGLMQQLFPAPEATGA